MDRSHPLWGVFQYEIVEAVSCPETASMLVSGRARALSALARRGGTLLGALDRAPLLAASFPQHESLEAFARDAAVVRWSAGAGPHGIDGSLQAATSDACLCTLDEGSPRPDPQGRLRVEVRGDPRPFGHPTRILRTLADAFEDDARVLAIGLPREARQWPWMQAIDGALASGVRQFLFSWGRLPLEETQGWDLLEAALECFVATSGACYVAAAGNAFQPEPALVPARSPLVLGIGGLCHDEGRWESYDATSFGPGVTNELSALVDDPTSGSGGTSFAAARIAARLARWSRKHPEASAERRRAVVLVSASPQASDPRGYHDVEERVGRSLGLGDPDLRSMHESESAEGRGPGSIDVARPSRVVIAWNCRPFEWSFRGTGPSAQALGVDVPVAFAAESWLMLETPARSITIETAPSCPWAAAWLPL